jgi:hypothetical protein
MSYDSWKLRSPDDDRRTFDCDCCGRSTLRRHVQQCWTDSGLETWACPACRGEQPEDDEQEEQTK